jgi:RNA polymerase sigma factor (TIGR02999 family)
MMSDPSPGLVTQILDAVEAGDPRAADELMPVVYSELRTLGRALTAKTPPGNTLQPTALVHEAYVRLVGKEDPGWNSRGHFFAAAARAMHQILVDQARRKAREKHGGGHRRVNVDDVDLAIEPPVEDVFALHEALKRLEERDKRKTDVVMHRFFAGLTIEETAKMLGVSEPTVERDWRFARTLLYEQLTPREPGDRESYTNGC